LAIVFGSGIGAVIDAVAWPEHSVGLKVGLLVGPLLAYLYFQTRNRGEGDA
jgi:hypothetical protein